MLSRLPYFCHPKGGISMQQILEIVNLLLIPINLTLTGWLVGNQKLDADRRKVILRSSSALLIPSALGLSIDFLTGTTDNIVGWLVMNSVSLLMMLLISFMAITLVKFSERYLQTEVNVHQYWRWLLYSLASVSVVILSNHLLLFWLGWVSISLSFHRLLLFYPNRPRAILAAHKKFILARIAETFMLAAFIILYLQHHTFQLNEITDYYLNMGNQHELSVYDNIVAVLIALTALIKCAQLPIHGWLIQVVEAPTPVSALLHAGIINLGGFLLITFAPLISVASVAQWIIIIIAGLSTLFSALVMTTRISIKVRLAWSTCAQMGLMLVECALGMYQLALLHLITHSLYKAYWFLNSGAVLQDYSLSQLAPQNDINLFGVAITVILTLGGLTSVVLLTNYDGPLSIWLLVSLSLAFYLANTTMKPGIKHLVSALFTVLLVLILYFIGKSFFGQLVPHVKTVLMFSAMDIWTMTLISVLFGVAILLKCFPNSAQSKTLSRWLFSGLYLDEFMTRLTLEIWPVRLRKQIPVVTYDKKLIEEPLI